MASLADELLADLEEPETELEKDQQDGADQPDTQEAQQVQSEADLGLTQDNSLRPPEMMDQEMLDTMQFDRDAVDSARSVSKLYESSTLKEMMESIAHYMDRGRPELSGAPEDLPEYHLIVRANNMAVDLDNEMMMLHKFIRERYSPRFPELETLVLNPWEFIRSVRALGNEPELVHSKLEEILPHGTVVVISMTAATTSGQVLAKDEWLRIQEACDMVQSLDMTRHRILQYVESRMMLLAPNLSCLVGTSVATKLVGVAGGLAALAKIPSCNLHLLGTSKRQATGLSSIHGNSTRFSGYLAQCELVLNTPTDYQTQALRMVSAKTSLAARMDVNASNGMRNGQYGMKLHQEIARKIDKLMEPPPAKLVKTLPVPSETGRKQRRGGRRARKFREAHGLTELRKMQNRVEFGKEEQEAGAFDETMGLGMINTKASGKIRAAVADSKSKAKMSKSNKARLATLNRPSLSLHDSIPSASSSSGTASSLAFTPVQGIELIDPSRQKKVEEANAKWFREGQFSFLPDSKKPKVPGLDQSDR
ncbi:U4/U6-U5 snRNP complex subunit prp31 [Malassezia yamatoensis]|uniref:U4/U6-U5 snRNP complex subunit prp31 n=1 Tax=Malassezia yamatoensis TaxID=253288 RepID=A0AAJ5YT18_9BASI|nr:U4/U6-U5 snRNP complex subunit prp31 [Malassezia yamatoensis]